jgi:hypothetical protein
MSLELTVYTKELSDNLIPKIEKRLNDFEMDCQIHPDFSFADHSGFLPFKFRLKNPPFEVLKDKYLMSGMEVYIDDFDFEKELNESQPKLTFIQKITGKKNPIQPFVNPDIDNKLKDCRKSITFVWHVADSFELRFASLTSAILSEMTNGVCTYHADDIWYDNDGFVIQTWADIKDYETNVLKEKDLKFHEFEKWE